ncbi:MAG TPA: hypothetical protein VLA54_14720, partial [Acidimicrobiia bacterium]|nr:hypothetical protein [Acidimicrobiia bacterium]
MALLLSGYGLARAGSTGQVLGSIESQGRPLGGLTRDEARAALIDLEVSLAITPAPFRLDGTEVALAPEAVGFDLDEERMADAALAVGRTGSAVDQFWWWLTHLLSDVELAVEAKVDAGAVETVLASWDSEVIGDAPFPGGVGVNGTTAEALYPRAGRQIDRSAALPLVLEQASRLDRPVIDLPVVEVHPSLDRAAIDRAVEQA